MLLRPSKSTVRYRRLSDDASTGSNVGASACIVIQELVSPQEFRSERNRCCERARKEEEDERAAVEPTQHFLSCHLQKWRSLSQRGTIPGSSSRRSPGAIGGALRPDVSPSHRSGAATIRGLLSVPAAASHFYIPTRSFLLSLSAACRSFRAPYSLLILWMSQREGAPNCVNPQQEVVPLLA